MSAHAYTEVQLVEQPAIGLFTELGWTTVSALEEAFGAAGTLMRETKDEVVLVGRLRAALERLNLALLPEAITAAVDELTRDRSAMSLEAANREVYLLLKDGIKVSVPENEPDGLRERGGQKTERLRVVDWEHPANNDFLLVSQFSVTGALYTCRPDLVCFVNGLPVVVIELKKPGVPARAAFDENLTHYKQQVPALFWFNALLIASNGTDSRVGSLTADWERFFEWKRIEREDEPRRVSLEVMIRGTCDRVRLLDLLENFTLFSEHKAGLVKIIGQNHQFLGVNNAIVSMLDARSMGHGRGGVYWQTQGSGKSFSMVFFAQKVLRKVAGNWTFVVVTDRVELDEQIAKTFKATGAVSEAEGDQCHAASGAHLRELLRGNHRYVFTLIHKFQTPEMLCDRPDVIVLTDEAHRSQYDTLALNMRAALEFAPRIGCLAAIADAIRAKVNPGSPDISGVMGAINTLLDASIEGVTMSAKAAPAIDLSKIDFEKLASHFKVTPHKNIDLETLKAAVRAMLARLIRLNKTRADFQEKFEELIEAYNAGSKNIDELFAELLALSRALTEEQTRHVRENLSEEELTILDILTRPAPKMNSEERGEVKKVARDVLAHLKELLVLNWRGKASARSQIKLAIEDILDSGLPRVYTPDAYQQKCSALFEHVYESYPERNQGVYAATA